MQRGYREGERKRVIVCEVGEERKQGEEEIGVLGEEEREE